MWMNISRHTGVCKKKKKKGREAEKVNEGYTVREKAGDIEMHEESSQFPSPFPESLMLHQLTLWSIAIEGQRASIRPRRAMLCQWRCVSGSADS